MRKKVSGYTRLSKTKIEHFCVVASICRDELIDRLRGSISKLDTIKRVLEGKQCQRQTALIVARALGLDSTGPLEDHPQDGRLDDGPHASELGPIRFREWDVVRAVDGIRRTSNGLVYAVYHMRNRVFADADGRGKCYFLRELAAEHREVAVHELTRHAEVCRRMRRHPSFPAFEEAGFVGDHYFWIVDRWEPGIPLSEYALPNGVQPDRLLRIMTDILSALAELHRNDIVRRELTPESVIIRNDGTPLLTDLELARLLDGSPTVSREWAENPFLAPEVGIGKVTKAADLFSWAQMLTFVATGSVPPKAGGSGILMRQAMPKELQKLATECIEMTPRFRPCDAVKALNRVKSIKS